MNKLSELNFTTDKVIIQDLSERGGDLTYHFLIKVENPTDNKISLPVIDLQNQSNRKIKTKFYLEINGKIYSMVSYLNGEGNQSLLLNSKNKSYVLLSLTEKINREDLECGFIKYVEDAKNKKIFPIVETNTEKIFTDHNINIEEAIMLIHGKINGKQY